MGAMAGTSLVDKVSAGAGHLASESVTDQELARAAYTRRKVEQQLTQEQVRDRSGLSITTIARIERGDPSVSEKSLRRYDLAVDWPPGTAASWRRGRGGMVQVPNGPSPETLSPALKQELRELAEELWKQRRYYVAGSVDLDGLPEPICHKIIELVDELRVYLIGIDKR